MGFGIYWRGLGVGATHRRGTAVVVVVVVVVLPGGCSLRRKGRARLRGDAGRDGVPPQAAMHLVKVAAHVGFCGKRFEAHWAGFASWRA